jgi:hypothetical protein
MLAVDWPKGFRKPVAGTKCHFIDWCSVIWAQLAVENALT